MVDKDSFLEAVLTKKLPEVTNLLNRCPANIRPCTDEGISYLHLAVFLKSKDLAQILVQAGLEVDERDSDKLTPLHRACRYGADDIARILLNQGADRNARANNSITPLHIAAYYDRVNCVQALCSKKLNTNRDILLDARDEDDHTPLHYASAEGNVAAACELMKFGSDPSAPNIVGNTPLHFAAASQTPMLLPILISHEGVEIDAQNFKGQTALHLAVLQACAHSVSILLNCGADPNVRDINGNTSLHLAFKSGHIDLVDSLLMDSRTDPSISDDDENTVLHLALKLGHYNMIPMMLPLASDLTRRNASGCTVIIEAIKNHLEELAIDMVRACPSLVDKATLELVTPLHLAAERGMTHLTKELLIAGAQVDAADSSGLTPSLYCAKNDSVLECLAMIEDLMMVPETPIEENGHRQNSSRANSSKIYSRISS